MKKRLKDWLVLSAGIAALTAAYLVASGSDYEQEKQIEERVCELYPRTVDYCREGEKNGR